MKIQTIIVVAALGGVISLSAIAQEKTEPVATDSEGMSPDQQAKKEKRKRKANKRKPGAAAQRPALYTKTG